MLIRTLLVVGGGGAYVPGLLEALLRRAGALRLEEVRLHDIDEPRLETVARLGRAMAAAEGEPFRVRADTDLDNLLPGADVVLNSARPGGFHCRRIDETLPLELGIPGQETIGPGGFFYALRSVPQALALARQIEERAPAALLLNYTNPSNIVTQAIVDHTSVRALGLCDQADSDLHTLASATGHAGRAWSFRCAGLNHATWYSQVRFDGKPFELPDGPPAPPAALDAEHRIRFRISWWMARRHPGFWPNSYLPYYERPRAFVDLARRDGPRTDAIVRQLAHYYRHFEEESHKERPRLRMHRGSKDFGDLATRLLEALGDSRRQLLALNVVNRGMLDGLEPETVVESVVAVSADGVESVPAPELPDGEIDRVRRLERYQRATARVVAAAERTRFGETLAENPLVDDLRTARILLERASESYGGEVALP